ncbi:hypothetical protein [Chryseobacterium indologenes]|uniref:hypothetical protein n=1 Tax=Chryseobacterium indologenes TaxID=253 RepID=UPI000648268C|nr:hypothetical protein [Chryseobacterium indologenes]
MKKRTLPATDKVIFYENEIPSLAAGTYTLKAALTLGPHETIDSGQQLVVNAPQVVIDPAEIHAMSPGMNEVDHFQYIIPSIVLNNPQLPWERKLKTKISSAPWMALLVFTEEELYWKYQTHSPVMHYTAADFLKKEEQIHKPDIALSDLGTDSINTIRIPVHSARSILPRVEELPLLAHVRTVNPENQVLENGTADHTYAVILSNRMTVMPAETSANGVRNYAFLVSLEGWENPLENNFKDLKDNDFLQLIVLANWSFTAISEISHHVLPVNAEYSKVSNQSNLLRIPVADNGSDTAKKILEGYTAISSEMRDGSKTFAWYRGPLCAGAYRKLPKDLLPCYNSDSAKIYLQKEGIFDHSYAAAWTLGRLMGLSDPLYTDHLQILARKTQKLSIQLLQRSRLKIFSDQEKKISLLKNELGKEAFIKQLRNGLLQESFDNLKAPFQDNSLPQKTDENSKAPFTTEDVVEFLDNEILQDVIKSEIKETLDAIAEWLAKTALLYNVPFQYLVPDQRMLPVESTRFFYVDKGWLTMLMEGARQLGVHSSVDKAIRTILNKVIDETIWFKTSGVRPQFFSVKKIMSQIPGIPTCGLLIRSSLVSQAKAPVIEAKLKNGKVIQPLRMDKLSSDVIIVLWDQVPDHVSVTYPNQNWLYGLTDAGKIELSNISKDIPFGKPLGKNFPDDHFSKFLRKDAEGKMNNVINIYAEGAEGVTLASEIGKPLNVSSLINGAQLAIQLKKHTRKMIFQSSI